MFYKKSTRAAINVLREKIIFVIFFLLEQISSIAV